MKSVEFYSAHHTTPHHTTPHTESYMLTASRSAFIFLSSSAIRTNAFVSLPPKSFVSVSISSSTATTAMSPLISAAEALASAPTTRFIDASWHLNPDRDGETEFVNEAIPNSGFFDMNAISCKASSNLKSLPHQRPSARTFELACDKLHIPANSSPVILYGTKGCFSIPRTYYLFKHYFGHANCQILDGGLEAWKNAGGGTEAGTIQFENISETIENDDGSSPTKYKVAKDDGNAMCDMESVEQALLEAAATVIDARPANRFLGEVPEPRAGMRSGHMKGALNVPFPSLLTSMEDQQYKPKSEIASIFADSMGNEEEIILTCGSGVTACNLALGMELAGKNMNKVRVYDGSWSEWGRVGGGEVVL